MILHGAEPAFYFLSEHSDKSVKYRIGKLVLWDTPGLGDGTEIDEHHRKVITELLRDEDDDGNALIDLVLVILDGSTRNLGTSYKLLNDVIIPELEEDTDRILIALNQADIAMKTGRHWDYEKNEPDETLKYEYKADAFAAKEGYGDELISALKQLPNDSLSNLNPHPVIVALEYSHPTITQRAAAIRKIKKNNLF